MNMTEKTLKNPVTVFMVFICFVVIGVIASRLLPLEYFPDMEYPSIAVNIPYPGSTPEEVERQITRPAEEALATISGIKRMFSNSGENGCSVFLLFDWGQKMNIKAVEVKEKVDSIRSLLPPDVEHISINQESATDIPVLMVRLSSNKDISEYYDILNRVLKRPIEKINGVSRVSMYGLEKKEVRIQLLADRISAHHVDLGKLSETLIRSNFMVTSGRITDSNHRLRVRPMGEINSIKELEELIVGENGLRLKDISTISYERPRITVGRHLNQKFAIGLEVFKEAGANTVETCNRIKKELDRIGKDPRMEGINLFFMNDQGEGILSSLQELLKSGYIGAALATLLLFFFMKRISTTLIVTLALPFSILVTLAFMFFFHLSLNILSMMGLLLAVGMLVDNAVVVTESIHRHQLLGKSRVEAAIIGVKEVALAITAGTFTTVVVFLPMVLSGKDDMSMYMKHVSISFVIALLSSLVMALTLVPLLITRVKLPKVHSENKLIERLSGRYSRILNWILLKRKTSYIIMVLILLSAAIPFILVKKDMFEQSQDRRLRLFYNLNGSYTLGKVEAAVDVIENYLYSHKDKFEIDTVYSVYESDGASSTILLKKGKGAHKDQETIKTEIQKNLPKISIGKLTFEFRRSGNNSDKIEITLNGDSSSQLADISKDVAKVLARVPGLIDVRSEAEGGDQEIQVVVDRVRATQLGFTTRQIANMVSIAMRGVNLRRFRDEYGEIDVRAEFRKGDKQTLDQLKSMVLYDSEKRPVMLTTLANIQVRRGPRNISREDRMTSIAVTMNLKGITLDEARTKISGFMDKYKLPPGYRWSFGRIFDDENEAARTMMINTLLALFLIYFIMAAIFESLVFPAAIWVSISFGIVGVFWFFLMTGTTFSTMAWIGVLILIGVVVNNGIVLIDHINRLRSSGINRHDAILQAGIERMRPIIMTAGTTIFGLIPLCIVTTQIGGDGPPYYPMARAIAGGLTFSTFITLLILPRIYVMLDDLRDWSKLMIKNASEKAAKPLIKRN